MQVYFVGETVSGQLHFTLTESKSYKYIEIRLYGGAHVRWTETRTSGTEEHRTRETVTYESNEVYVNEANILWHMNQTPHGKIGPGTFDLPFQLVIPPNCLSSFQGSVGTILYALHGLIKTGMLHRDHTIQAPLQVSRITDINIPQLLMPVYQSRKRHVGFFCLGSDVEFTVSLDRTGFCIGHNLPMTLNVVNGSSRRIKIRASIRRHCYYYARGHTNSDRRIFASVVTPDITPHSQQTVAIENLTVPMAEPTFGGSQIINMQYFLKVTAVVPWARNASVKIPITLGNVPLRNNTV